MNEALPCLAEPLVERLRNETYCLLNTVDAESGGPTCTAVSWVYAVDAGTLRLAIDHRSRLVRNMKVNPLVNLTIFAEEAVHAVSGRAAVRQEPLEGVPFSMCCFDVQVEAVRNALFYGAKLDAAPTYVKTYDRRASEKLDGQVFDAMKKA
ncbi:hypothetical protein F4V43_03815 [Paenibacillus spiritus]|uniref:Pyridoxamine 5'-phosphate oxidase N-terminal domain-containing protein n=1 Tax=Paenibacillus spiritus TaxID=2496557 RepID=A0A5J5GJ20_9BACL|nr:MULTISPECIES: pyridoxamine 5'-phosphate oxidase family protein [Paenibacillus]KAA9007622.1 hypothetical protein F4V43_03815 [Paenibacillus spiritus]